MRLTEKGNNFGNGKNDSITVWCKHAAGKTTKKSRTAVDIVKNRRVTR